ncbi:MAG: Fe-S cluster assembly protein SufD [Microscillaceae bacterium]|nr:Fe-S cluster assembly protein SufD [Microscillaceae bacterium]
MHQITDSRSHNTFAQPRMLWVFEEGSRAVLLDQCQTLGENASWNNAVSEIYVGPKAHIQHYKIQNDQPQAHLTQTTEVHQKGQSIYENITISLNGGLVRNNLHIALEGEYIESNMFGLFMLTGQTLVDNHSIADHRQPNSVSNELYKGILDERSTGVFNGKIYVRPQAQKTNAYQQNRTILLKDTASINTKPQLEIWADDVKCSHGATTGNLDESSLFYLRARGVPEAQARALLIRAFGNEIVEKIKLPSLRQYLEQEIDARLGAV